MHEIGSVHKTLSGKEITVFETGIRVVQPEWRDKENIHNVTKITKIINFEDSLQALSNRIKQHRETDKFCTSESGHWVVLLFDGRITLIGMSLRLSEIYIVEQDHTPEYEFIAVEFSSDEKYLFALSEKDKLRKLVVFGIGASGVVFIRDYYIQLEHSLRTEITLENMSLLEMRLEGHIFVNLQFRVDQLKDYAIFEIPHDYYNSCETEHLPRVDIDVEREVIKYFPCMSEPCGAAIEQEATPEVSQSPTSIADAVDIFEKNAMFLQKWENELQERYMKVEKAWFDIAEKKKTLPDRMIKARNKVTYLADRMEMLINGHQLRADADETLSHMVQGLRKIERMRQQAKELEDFEIEEEEKTRYSEIKEAIERIEETIN